MYIRRKKSPNSPRQSIQVVEGYRDATGKVKQRIVRHLGVFYDELEEAKLAALAEELIAKIKAERELESAQMSLFGGSNLPLKKGRPLKKNLSDILPADQVKLTDLVEVDRIVEGVHEVGSKAYSNLKFDQLLKRKRDREILQDLVLARMVEPSSKRGLQHALQEQYNKKHDLDAIYRLMDKLHEQIPLVKELTFRATLSLIPKQEVGLVLFDVTTLYFESIETDDLRAFGYSKDHRFNTTQVVLALATNEDGLPIGYELFRGNTAEVNTLLAAIRSWESYLKIKDIVFIADRAMFSSNNLEALDASGYRYIVAAKLRKLKSSLQEEILCEENYHMSVLGNNLAWIAEFEHEGKRLITSYKTCRARNDAKEREKVVNKIRKTLGAEGSTKKLISNHGVKKYTTSQNNKSHVDEIKIAEDAMWDGLHGVITNDKTMQASEIISKYSRLWMIEAQFRINKHNLEMRPIYHWTPQRIEAHIALCYMSYAVLKHIEYRVNLMQKVSVNNIVENLQLVQSSILRHTKTGDLYRLPGHMKNDARRIYKAYAIKRSDTPEIYLK